jgi:hypothetical protein
MAESASNALTSTIDAEDRIVQSEFEPASINNLCSSATCDKIPFRRSYKVITFLLDP